MLKERIAQLLGLGRPIRAYPPALVVSLAIVLLSPPAAADIESPFCSLPPDPAAPWLPITPAQHETAIPSPRPASDCQFYRPAWQRFLVATQPVNGVPAFLRYPSFDQIFQSAPAGSGQSEPGQLFTLKLQPRNIQRPNDPNEAQQKLLDNVQAGIGGGPGGNLIDQSGHFIYYAIHVNPAFLQFLQNQGLTTVDGIKQIDPSLTFLVSES